MENFKWDVNAAPESLIKYGFIKRYDQWIFELVVDIETDGFNDGAHITWYDCVGAIVLNSDGSIEAAGQVDTDLVEQMIRDGIIFEVK